MSNVKRDLMKEIDAKVARKKLLSEQISRQKTVAKWVAEFYTEHENMKRLANGADLRSFAFHYLDILRLQLRNLDRDCYVNLTSSDDGNTLLIKIHWSSEFIRTNACEEVLVLDSSSAFFQSAIEDF